MPILLKDIRSAVQNYINMQVLSNATFSPTGSSMNVGEDFGINFEVRNNAMPDAIQLINIVYHVRIANSNIAKLKKPSAAQGVARTGPTTASPVILDTAYPVAEYYLHPPVGADPKTLTVGEVDVVAGLPAKALAIGNTSVMINVYADPDLNWLFPKNEDSPVVSKAFSVLE